MLVGAGATLAVASMARAGDALELTGRFQQGGHIIGRTWAGAHIFVDEEALTTASANGLFIVGLDREAKASVRIEARDGARYASRALAVQPGSFPSSRIDGLPPSTVEPSDPALLALIQQQIVLKAEGFASRFDADFFSDGFDWPLERFRVSSAWGSQRILNGTAARPHFGIDLAAPQGTVIRAPARGLVTLAQPGMHFEGGLVLIDHGQGLITAYLHQSEISVTAGDTVRTGDTIGRVGMTGRATGPHLCWRMKWRDRNLDPSLMVRTA
ncbi:M23 family metallopeptidase [Brevundimonas variabilis]|uniref:Murein DD-endopeptidase MepM/ murein hydrolase activator NlpD n=1 Tax=Brevundimonas variabilis TaxID=74312 RepID=A0A7W9FG61_9CAUL|nr:murein DD-endopeptidase MepM/ murein hydrolase activator NlpD [Brevundimonas variabilis]